MTHPLSGRRPRFTAEPMETCPGREGDASYHLCGGHSKASGATPQDLTLAKAHSLALPLCGASPGLPRSFVSACPRPQ